MSICYGVATISRLLKMIRLFCKRALWKRRYSAKETYNCKEPTNWSHPIFPLPKSAPGSIDWGVGRVVADDHSRYKRLYLGGDVSKQTHTQAHVWCSATYTHTGDVYISAVTFIFSKISIYRVAQSCKNSASNTVSTGKWQRDVTAELTGSNCLICEAWQELCEEVGPQPRQQLPSAVLQRATDKILSCEACPVTLQHTATDVVYTATLQRTWSTLQRCSTLQRTLYTHCNMTCTWLIDVAVITS